MKITHNLINYYCYLKQRKYSWIAFLLLFLFTITLIKMSLYNKSRNTEISFRFPYNQIRRYEISQEASVSQEIGKKENRLTNISNTKMRFSYKTFEQGKKGRNVWVEFDSFTLNNKVDGVNEISNYTNSFQKALQVFNGAVFELILEGNGEIKNINGYQKFIENFDRIYYLESKDDASKLLNTYSEIFSERYFKDIFETITNILPSKSIQIGSIWRRKENKEFGRNKILNTTYECYRIAGEIVYIKSLALVEEDLVALNNTIKMTGTQSGEIEIDAKTGMVIKDEKTLSTEGVLDIGGTNVKMSVKRKTLIEIKNK